MTLEAELFADLKPLVNNRVYPSVFPQPTSGLPVWPAIRYAIVSSVPVEDLCGDGDDTTADVRVQLDVVASTYSAMRTLRLQVMAVMVNFYIPARLDLSMDDYDVETKTHRGTLDYMISGSSDPPAHSPA
jgi:hypothetical protein